MDNCETILTKPRFVLSKSVAQDRCILFEKYRRRRDTIIIVLVILHNNLPILDREACMYITSAENKVKFLSQWKC